MKKSEVEVLSEAVNAWVVRTPGRQFPALVVQGDTFSTFLSAAEALLKKARNSKDKELIEETKELRDALLEKLRHYEKTLKEHGIALPYMRAK